MFFFYILPVVVASDYKLYIQKKLIRTLFHLPFLRVTPVWYNIDLYTIHYIISRYLPYLYYITLYWQSTVAISYSLTYYPRRISAQSTATRPGLAKCECFPQIKYLNRTRRRRNSSTTERNRSWMRKCDVGTQKNEKTCTVKQQ